MGVGLLITVFAWGLYRGTASLAALVSVGLSGLGFAGTGVFPADMADLSAPSSRAHIVMSLISFAAFVPGAFVLCWRFLKLPRWAPVGIASGALALLAIASMLLREMDVPPGLAQRTTFVVYLVWIELLAVALWRRRTGFRAANGPH